MLTVEEIKASNKSVTALLKDGRLDDAIKLLNKTYLFSLKIDYNEGIVFFFRKSISIFMMKAENYKCLSYIQNLIEIYKKENNIIELGQVYINYGTILTTLKDFKSANYYLKKALDIHLNAIDLNYKDITFSYIGLSFIASTQQKNHKSLQYINDGIKYMEVINNQEVNIRFLNISKLEILIDLNDIDTAEKLLERIKTQKSVNKYEELDIYNLEIRLLAKKPIVDEELFVQKVNLCVKKNIELFGSEGIIFLLQILKEYYLENKNLEQAYKFSNEIIEIEAKNKKKQVSVVEINKGHVKKNENIKEEFEIYNKSELELAAKYQQNFYSKMHQSKKLNIQTLYTPSKTLSGDYIGIFDLGKNKTLTVLADVVGKGITASYISFLLDGIIKTIIRTTNTFNLNKNISDINVIISDSLKNEGFVSLWAGIIDTNKNELQSVNAGHLPVFVIKKDEIIELNEGSTIIGMFEKLPKINVEIISFFPSDVLIAYSDGITESVNKKNEDFENKFKLLIEKYSKTKSFNFIEKLESDLNAFQDSVKSQDDISCLFVEYNNTIKKG